MPTTTELLDEVATLRRQLAEVTARLDALAPSATASPPGAVAPATTPMAAVDVPVDRRAALRRGAGLAAAAVAGGAAIVAGTASPAAAETLTGSGQPGVQATGIDGDGIVATTTTAGFAAVRCKADTADTYALKAIATEGIGAEIRGGSNGWPALFAWAPVGSTGAAIRATSEANSALVAEGTAPVAPALDVRQYGTGASATFTGPGPGIRVTGNSTSNEHAGVTVQLFREAADLWGQEVGARLTGANANLVLVAAPTSPPTRSVSHAEGSISYDGQDVWLCTAGGTPGTWRKLGGTTTAGAFHVLPAPARVYDSRPGTAPLSVGPKTPLAGGTVRGIDLKANSSGVPAGATAALVTILLVNATAGSGNFTLWRNGVAKPQANTLVWGGSAGRYAITAVTALDSSAKVQISANLATDVVLDVVGYYR